VTPSKPAAATRHTGYQVGGISPFGTRTRLPVYVEATILDLPRIFINGGSRGFLLGLAPADLVRVLNPVPVRVGIAPP
jgi:Cys-tRNA(Pro) deacylase